MPEVKFVLAIDGVPNDVRPGDARVGAALAAAPVSIGGQIRRLDEALEGTARAGHTLVADADYQCLSTDLQVGMKPLTAARTIWLPDVDTFPFQDLVIADESGACSEALSIKIRPGASTDDTIGGADTDPDLGVGVVALSSPYQAVRFRRGAANLWIRL